MIRSIANDKKGGDLFMSEKNIEMFLVLLPVTGIPCLWRCRDGTCYVTDKREKNKIL